MFLWSSESFPVQEQRKQHSFEKEGQDAPFCIIKIQCPVSVLKHKLIFTGPIPQPVKSAKNGNNFPSLLPLIVSQNLMSNETLRWVSSSAFQRSESHGMP